MFTGIIEEQGKIASVTNNGLTIQAHYVLDGTKIGDSIAVNGVCLTVVKINRDCFDADISPETKKVTTLGSLKLGEIVNLERAVPINGRLGGHIVSGHTDCKGKCISINKENECYNLKIELPSEYTKYTVKKGSITINGISLTIAEIYKNTITIALIPHTFENTNLKCIKNGDFVNIETDILAKYVEKFLSTSDNKSGIDMEFLVENGF